VSGWGDGRAGWGSGGGGGGRGAVAGLSTTVPQGSVRLNRSCGSALLDLTYEFLSWSRVSQSECVRSGSCGDLCHQSHEQQQEQQLARTSDVSSSSDQDWPMRDMVYGGSERSSSSSSSSSSTTTMKGKLPTPTFIANESSTLRQVPTEGRGWLSGPASLMCTCSTRGGTCHLWAAAAADDSTLNDISSSTCCLRRRGCMGLWQRDDGKHQSTDGSCPAVRGLNLEGGGQEIGVLGGSTDVVCEGGQTPLVGFSLKAGFRQPGTVDGQGYGAASGRCSYPKAATDKLEMVELGTAIDVAYYVGDVVVDDCGV
jgi:hypothetical protein